MSTIRRSNLSSLSIAIAVLGGAAIVGCGSTAANGGPSTSPTNVSALRFSQCMRANGVPNLPDPGPGGSRIGPGSDINLKSPAAQSALNACQRYLPRSEPSPPVPASVRREEIAFAKCMRANGSELP